MNEENERLLKRYLMICQNRGLTRKTIDGFSVDMKVFLRWLGDKNIKEVTHDDCDNFLFYCQETRNNGDQALARKFTTLNSFFKTMIKKDYLDKNPMDKLDKVKIRKKQRGHLTDNEMQQVFDYLESINDLRGLALFSLLFSSGIRLSELYQLNRDSLDFENRRFKVLGKGDKERICIFSEYAKQNILNYLGSRADNLEPLFISREQNRLSKRAIQRIVKLSVYRSGLTQEITPHCIRHSCAMSLLKKGVPLNIIQVVLGHENIATTQIYAHNNIDDAQRIVDALQLRGGGELY